VNNQTEKVLQGMALTMTYSPGTSPQLQLLTEAMEHKKKHE
jgi:hypothetical protein